MTSAGPTPTARVCVVEDDSQVLQSVTTYLTSAGFRVRGFSSALDFLSFWEWSTELDCIVTDVRMPDMDGLTLLKEIRKRAPGTPVILITGHGDVTMAVSAMKAGATDFIQKPLDPQQLKSSIMDAMATRSRSGNEDARSREARQRIREMSDRQREVLALVTQGLTSKEIGNALQLSFRTVESHRASIMDQLNAKSLADLIRISLQAELQTPGEEGSA